MDVLYQSCAGIDVHQANILVCILHDHSPQLVQSVRWLTFDTRTKGLRACHDFLSQFHVEAVGSQTKATIRLGYLA